MNNTPVMFYTPNKESYLQTIQIPEGMGQVIPYERCEFDLNYLVAFDLYKLSPNYYPIILSMNYEQNGKNYAFMTYGRFTKTSDNVINGIHVEKQVVLINGMPFEIKSIYGLKNTEDKDEVDADNLDALVGEADDGQGKECLVCLSDQKNTVIMPCGHMCVCQPCG